MRPLTTAAVVACSFVASACATQQAAVRPEAFPRSRAVVNAAAEPEAAMPEAAAPLRASSPSVSAPATAAVLQSAFDLLGTKYRFGGETPESGFDCSGFVSYVLRQHGVELPRTVAEQFAAGRSVAQDDIQPGDLVFFTTTGPGATHVGLVVTSGSRYEFIHAPADGASVRIERFDTGYWQQRWLGARRVF